MWRFDMRNFEWRIIEPLLPNRLCSVAGIDDRRILSGIIGFGRVLRGAIFLSDMNLIPLFAIDFIDVQNSRYGAIKRRINNENSRIYERIWLTVGISWQDKSMMHTHVRRFQNDFTQDKHG